MHASRDAGLVGQPPHRLVDRDRGGYSEHAYAVLDAFEVGDGSGAQMQFLKIYNPHAMDDGAVGGDREDGVFVMSMADVVATFAEVAVC